MTDTRTIKTPTEIEWERAMSLEVWMEKALREGKDREVLAILKTLPEDKRERYRAIWTRVRAERGARLPDRKNEAGA